MSQTRKLHIPKRHFNCLLVEDELGDAENIASCLRRIFTNPSISHCVSRVQAVRKLSNGHFYDFAFVDLRIPVSLSEINKPHPKHGLHVIRSTAPRNPATKYIAVTHYDVRIDYVNQARDFGARYYLPKGELDRRFAKSLRAAVHNCLAWEKKYLVERIDGVVKQDLGQQYLISLKLKDRSGQERTEDRLFDKSFLGELPLSVSGIPVVLNVIAWGKQRSVYFSLKDERAIDRFVKESRKLDVISIDERLSNK